MKKLLFASALVFFISLVYYLRDVLFPFVLAAVIAYMTLPVHNLLSKKINSKSLVSFLVVLSLLVIIILLFFFLLPKIYYELNHLIKKISNYPHIINQQDIRNKYSFINPSSIERFQEILSSASGSIFNYLLNSLYGMWNRGIAFFNFISIIFLVPIISFYFIRDYKKIFDSIEKLATYFISKHIKTLLREKLFKLHLILQTYIKAQINVSLIFICYYSIALKLLNLESAMTIGIVSGLLIIIPYMGFIISLFIAASVCIIQFTDISKLIVVFIIYALGQIIESNFVTPKLIGEKMNLHPVWIIFAVLFCGRIFGVTGTVTAIPLAAIMQFAMKEIFIYKIKSQKYYEKI